MFNFSGSEIVFLLLLALIILGPDKLPEAIKKFGQTYAEFKKVSSGFQNEIRSALDEPLREMRSTADILKNATNFDTLSDSMKPVSDTMAAATPAQPQTATPQPGQTPPAQPQADEPQASQHSADDGASNPASEKPADEPGQEDPTA